MSDATTSTSGEWTVVRAAEVRAAAGRIAALMEALGDALEFIEDHEDVADGPDGAPRPNRAMQLAESIRAVIAASPSVAHGEAD